MREAQVPVSAVLVAVVGANPEEIEPAGESDGDGHKRYGSGRQGAGSEGQIGPKCRSHRQPPHAVQDRSDDQRRARGGYGEHR